MTELVAEEIKIKKIAPIAGDLSELKIGDFVLIIFEEMERPINWTELFDEYLFMTKGNSNNAMLELHKQAEYFKSMFIVIDKLIEMVCLDQNLKGAIELNDVLRKMTRIRGKGKINKDELQRHTNVRTSYAKKLEEKRADIGAMNADDKGSTKQDWNRQIQMLGKYQGFVMNTLSTSVADYCAVLANFKEDNKPKKGFKYNN